MGLGIRQARYFGRAKNLFQVLMAATVANLTLVAIKMGPMGSSSSLISPFGPHILGLLATISPFLGRSRPVPNIAHRDLITAWLLGRISSPVAACRLA